MHGEDSLEYSPAGSAKHGRDSCVRGYHEYKDIWAAAAGEELTCEKECHKVQDRYVVSVKTVVVGHLPRSILRLWSLLLRQGGIIICTVKCEGRVWEKIFFLQVQTLCPAVLHLLQTRAHFAGGWRCSVDWPLLPAGICGTVSCQAADVEAGVEVEGAVDAAQGVSGRGQIISHMSSGQYLTI